MYIFESLSDLCTALTLHTLKLKYCESRCDYMLQCSFGYQERARKAKRSEASASDSTDDDLIEVWQHVGCGIPVV